MLDANNMRVDQKDEFPIKALSDSEQISITLF